MSKGTSSSGAEVARPLSASSLARWRVAEALAPHEFAPREVALGPLGLVGNACSSPGHGPGRPLGPRDRVTDCTSCARCTPVRLPRSVHSGYGRCVLRARCGWAADVRAQAAHGRYSADARLLRGLHPPPSTHDLAQPPYLASLSVSGLVDSERLARSIVRILSEVDWQARWLSRTPSSRGGISAWRSWEYWRWGSQTPS